MTNRSDDYTVYIHTSELTTDRRQDTWSAELWTHIHISANLGLYG